jgi:hypothetical protein
MKLLTKTGSEKVFEKLFKTFSRLGIGLVIIEAQFRAAGFLSCSFEIGDT